MKKQASKKQILYFVDELFYPVRSGGHRVLANQVDYFRRKDFPVKILLLLMPYEKDGLQDFLDYYDDLDIEVIRFWKEEPSLFHDFCSYRLPYTFENQVKSYQILSKSKILRKALKTADIFFTNYVFKTPLLNCLPPKCYKILETIDIQSAQFAEQSGMGRLDPAMWTREKQLLRRWDMLLMISWAERAFVRAEIPEQPVLFLPQYLPGQEADADRSASNEDDYLYDIAYISTSHPPNVKNLYRFYFDVYLPHLKWRGIRFAVAGNVCKSFTVEDPSVVRLGWVDDLKRLYCRTRIVVCPIWHGAGANIKALEAMSHGKAIVITSKGLESLHVGTSMLPKADEPEDFADKIVDLLDDDAKRLQAEAAARSVVEINHSRKAYTRIMDCAITGDTASRLKPELPKTWMERFLGRLIKTDQNVDPQFFFLQVRRALTFYLANHLLDKIPFYRMRYWYLRRFCKYKIGQETSIAPTTFFTGNLFEIGNNSVINRQCYLDAREGLYIGSNVSISNQTYIQTASHDPRDADFVYVPGPVYIEDYVWIGARAIISPGVTIGEGSVVGAGSLVTRDVKPYTIVGGVPARALGTRPRNLHYRLNYFPMFDTDYAPYMGIQSDAGDYVVLSSFEAKDLHWSNVEPRMGEVFSRDRLSFGGENRRSLTCVHRPVGTDAIRVIFKRTRRTRNDAIVVYLDWYSKTKKRLHLGSEIIWGANGDCTVEIPKNADSLVLAFKAGNKDVVKAVTHLKIFWLQSASRFDEQLSVREEENKVPS